ncbi:MAG TPA: S8 family serine peptidase [Actinoallomurus sp.]
MSPTIGRRMTRAGLAVLAALALAAAPAVSMATSSATADGEPSRRSAGTDPLAAVPVKRACPDPARPGQVTCLALVRTDVTPQHGVQPQGRPSGLGATDLRDAYRLPTASGGAGQTVAIINVFDDPKAESDLAVYRAQYGLPACTTANGCFRKVNAQGGTTLPRADTGWAEEMSLDLDMVSAACPLCHILLVEADQPSIATLGVGVDTAVRLGAKYISNSYGGPEEATTSAADFRHFDHPGVAITAASGDGGYGVLFPATSPRVTAVGGTSLLRAANARGWNETAWSGAGSGCSAHAVKPVWQRDAGCPRRTVADVSAVADPRTGVAVYDTFGFGGWQVVGGTSASAPIIAGAYALAGSPPSDYPAALPYAHPTKLNDVVQGSTGMCNPAYLCTAGPGYDGPTGLGTPNGVAAFGVKPSGQRARPAGTDRPGITGPGRRARAAAVSSPRPAAATPSAPTGIRNGGFETGSLSGWSRSGVMTGVTKDHPHSGKYAALVGDPDDPHRGDSSIRQSFTAAPSHRRLSFWYNVSCLDREKHDWATASLRDDTTGSAQTVLPRTCTYENTWEQVTAPVIGGHAYTLTLVSHDDGYFGDPSATKYDDVTLS